MRVFLLAVAALLSMNLWAQPQQAILQEHSAAELQAVLERADALPQSNKLEPIVVVLTGAEIELFKREQYREQKSLVDLAARLNAFAIIELKVSEAYLTQQQLALKSLPAFLAPVPDGAAYIAELQQQGYSAF